MSKVVLRTATTEARGRAAHPIETWVAEYGEITGVGSTKAAALRNLANRMDVAEAVNAEADDP